MRARTPTLLVWLLCAGLVAAALVLVDRNAQTIGNPGIAVGQALTIVALLGFATVGAAICRHRPQNRMGWVFLGGATLSALQFAAGEYALRALASDAGQVPLARYAAWLFTWIDFPAIFGLLVLTLFLFPDGAVPSPRWRLPLTLTAAGTALVTIVAALAPGPLPDPAWKGVWTNPFGVVGAWGRLLHAAAAWGYPLTAVSLATGGVALAVRYRRSGPQQRRQIKWLVYALALTVVLLAWVTVAPHPGRLLEGVQGIVIGLAVLAIPVGAGIGILKHRLYDIDRLINRTLVYGLLTVLLGGVYAGAVLVLGQLSVGIGTQPPSWAVAGATLAVAALFQPARRRIQAAVDRRFNRRRYDAAKTIQAFSARLRDRIDLDTLTAELLAVVRQTMEPTGVSLWLRPPTRASHANAMEPSTAQPAGRPAASGPDPKAL
jgi:hypothetical protein